MSIFKALDLWIKVRPYANYPCRTISTRLLPAEKHGRIKHYYDGSRYMGFVTWAWFTEEEARTLEYGSGVFSRESGDVLRIVDMIAPGGNRDVFYIGKDIRSHLSMLYPEAEVAYAQRRGRVGSFARRD